MYIVYDNVTNIVVYSFHNIAPMLLVSWTGFFSFIFLCLLSIIVFLFLFCLCFNQSPTWRVLSSLHIIHRLTISWLFATRDVKNSAGRTLFTNQSKFYISQNVILLTAW